MDKVKFNRLTFLEEVGPYISPGGYVLKKGRYLCECGKIKEIRIDQVVNGATKSCGCLHKEITSNANKTHGMSKTKEYKVWDKIKQRCGNVKNKRYKDYGGRGIDVCERWESFENFFIDMGYAPSKKYQIDRKDNNGNYDPDNCRWVVNRINCQNTRFSKKWVINGICYLSLSEAGKFCGIDTKTVRCWCEGRKMKNGKFYQPKERCYSYKVYA